MEVQKHRKQGELNRQPDRLHMQVILTKFHRYMIKPAMSPCLIYMMTTNCSCIQCLYIYNACSPSPRPPAPSMCIHLYLFTPSPPYYLTAWMTWEPWAAVSASSTGHIPNGSNYPRVSRCREQIDLVFNSPGFSLSMLVHLMSRMFISISYLSSCIARSTPSNP